jgi:hypothetical protein
MSNGYLCAASKLTGATHNGRRADQALSTAVIAAPTGRPTLIDRDVPQLTWQAKMYDGIWNI